MTMGHWRAVCWVHLEDGLNFGLPAWIRFLGLAQYHREVRFFLKSCRDPVLVAVPQVFQEAVGMCQHTSHPRRCNAGCETFRCYMLSLQSWSLKNLPANPTNLSGPDVEEELMRCGLYQLQKKSCQAVDIWSPFLPYFFFAGIVFSTVLHLLHI